MTRHPAPGIKPFTPSPSVTPYPLPASHHSTRHSRPVASVSLPLDRSVTVPRFSSNMAASLVNVLFALAALWAPALAADTTTARPIPPSPVSTHLNILFWFRNNGVYEEVLGFVCVAKFEFRN